MGTITEFYTDAFPGVPHTVPIEETYRRTEDALEKAKVFLDKCSRGMLALHSIAGSSRPEFEEVRTQLTGHARIYTSLHFPLSVSVVRDVRDVFNLYAGYDIKKINKKTLEAMEKTITVHSTNSADSSHVHGILLSELEGLRIDVAKKSETLKKDARKLNETCETLRQKIRENKAQTDLKLRDYEAQKEMHSMEKVEHNEETVRAAALILKHREDERDCEKEADKARKMKENAEWKGTLGAVIGGVGAATMAGNLIVGATTAVVGVVGAVTAKIEEWRADGAEKAALFQRKIATQELESATAAKERARMMADEADQKMRKADRDAVEVAIKATKDEYQFENEANLAKEGAEECDIAVELLSSVLDPLQQFIKAIETISEFLSGLASDLDTCVREVRAGRKNGTQRMHRHFELMQTYIDKVRSRCDNFESFQVVVQGRINALPSPLRALDAPASTATWVQKHEDSGSLSKQQSDRIRVRLHLKVQRPPSGITFAKIDEVMRKRRSICINRT